MSDKKIDKLLVCFISALDKRRINETNTPYMYNLIKEYSSCTINTIPEVDLDPTILTGKYPHEHEMWQLEINSDLNYRSLNGDILDKIPDFITTTFQCLIHLITGNYDLAAIPRWRRKRFTFKKTRYYKRTVENFLKLNELDTIFGMIGGNNCNYIYIKSLDELNESLGKLFEKEYKLEFIEVHALDTIQHWNLDDMGKLMGFYKVFDDYVKKLHEACIEQGVILVLLSEHGMEPVRGYIDITEQLKSIEIPRCEYSYYIEAPKTRFFFHSDRAHKKILDLLYSIDNGNVLSYKDLHKYNVKFVNSKQGEYYLVADPGYIFFPNDFYHPIANIFLGIKDWQQRKRLTSPKYRGYHGYLPEHDSEKGFMIVTDQNLQTPYKDANIVDIAPSVLGLLGVEKSKNLHGKILFK